MSHRSVHAAGIGCTVSVMLLLATVAAAVADPVAEFYKGKTISLIIASGYVMARAGDVAWPSVAITAAAVAVLLRTRLSTLWILIAGGALGALGLL